jgi:hypothetical protein
MLRLSADTLLASLRTPIGCTFGMIVLIVTLAAVPVAGQERS